MSETNQRTPATLETSPNLQVCVACGTQYDVEEGQFKDECRICDVCQSMVLGSSITDFLSRILDNSFHLKGSFSLPWQSYVKIVTTYGGKMGTTRAYGL